uniref:TLC domain-containing protein n=1 Tax=Favella ehrenbergii TaxID=182087 RepID=A0A7S3I6F3_9SPIT|mmetsp:Transcript_37853/g.46071  ORF Transcript_37853/g.46071 Transcript_37853/m.46071 type:complete len:165 (+) Transcript_37853:509-1003(+)
MFIFLEVSTPFVCTRWILFHHGYKGTSLQTVNTVLLFVTFIFGRVVMQVYLVLFFAVDWVAMTLQKDDVPLLYKAFLIEMSAAVLINVALNFFWSYLIVAQLVRIIRQGNEAETSFEGGDGAKDLEGSKARAKQDDLDETSRSKREEVEMNQILDPAQPASDNV